MTMANIPQTASVALLSLSENPLVIILAINVIPMLVGTFMDMTPAVLVFTPFLLPIATSLSLWLPVESRPLKAADVEAATFPNSTPSKYPFS